MGRRGAQFTNKQYRPFKTDISEEAVMKRVTLEPKDQPTAPRTASQRKKLSEALDNILDMTESELLKFKTKTDLTNRDKVALKWFDRLEEIALRGGPQILAEALDRLEGKVVIEHRLRGAGDKSNLSDAELDAIWRKRQSRVVRPKTSTQPSGPSLPH